jgi:thiosulfate/3-mercaptopyruvate sulfurtransferase
MRIIISASEAHEIITKSENVVIFDCRGDLNDKELGLKQYHAAHLPNAHFIDCEKDLSSGVKQHGDRHPLPDLEEFVLMLEKFGVSNNSSVITYGLYAPRLVFMLNLIGLSTAYFIDGGFDSWQKAGLTISTGLPQQKTGGLTNNFQSQLLVEMAEVLAKLDNPDVKLIDSRAPERYRGEVEPLDRIPGHIPSAENYFWQANFGADGLLKPRKFNNL